MTTEQVAALRVIADTLRLNPAGQDALARFDVLVRTIKARELAGLHARLDAVLRNTAVAA